MYDFYVKAPNGEIKTRKQKNLYQFVSDEKEKKGEINKWLCSSWTEIENQ